MAGSGSACLLLLIICHLLLQLCFGTGLVYWILITIKMHYYVSFPSISATIIVRNRKRTPLLRLFLFVYLNYYCRSCGLVSYVVFVLYIGMGLVVKNLTLLHANNKGTDRPVHPCSLISALVIIYPESKEDKLGSCKISIF